MARASRLKVYRTPVGFFDALVAAPSQKAALEAWGVRANLFALGEAEVVDDPELTAEALARPGEVIRKPRGDAAALVAAAKRPFSRREASAAPAAAPAPDRSALDAAEAALAAAERALVEKLDALASRRAELDREEEALKREGRLRIGPLERARDREARAFQRAGGSD